jgi:group I intron endonuclease
MLVYLITNQINQKRYVGITSRSIAERFEEHCNQIESKKTKKSAIHEAIVKHGRENFTIEQIDSAQTTEELYQKEKYWIEKLGTYKTEYNLTLGGDGSLGRVLSEETKNKIREKTKQRMQSPEQRQHLAEKTKQYFEHHPEEREKRRIAQTGYVPSKETCEKISRANKGKTRIWSDEAKRRFAESFKNRDPMVISEKCKELNRQRFLSDNPMQSPENRRKVGLSKIGRKRYYRADGSFYMAFPDNPIDPRI